MPLWLGEQFQFPEAVTRQLLLTNVMLVAYARLFDDLADGEDQAYCGMSPALGSILLHLLSGQYRSLFQLKESSFTVYAHFWAGMDALMRNWWRATLNPNPMVYPPFGAYRDEDFLRMADRGAFLKVSMLAACLLGDRPDLIPALSSAVERLTVGVILLDEQFDWEKDLFSGRYNTFVAYCSDLPQTPDQQETNQIVVLNEIYLKTSGRAYFEKIQLTLEEARQNAALAGCSGLVNYSNWLMQESKACGDWLAASSVARLRAAAERLKLADRALTQAPANSREFS